MANMIGTPTVVRQREQFTGMFTDMWTVKATISDQDAVAIGDTARFSLTVPGVALGDMVIGLSVDEDLSDGTDQAIVQGYVTAANTVVFQVAADAGEFAADTLNGKIVRMVVVRPKF